ncbi:MAG: glycosyltransferase family 2 protein [Lysobacterales bacterium]
MPELSVFVTTLNNDRTLGRLLDSVAFADEIVLLDSFSSDETVKIAQAAGCRVEQSPFSGYGPQKQKALDLTRHRWVLLMDADEALTPQAQRVIADLLKTEPDCAGYRLPRIEQMFWRLQSERSRLNDFLRLFDKTRGKMGDMPIHAAPEVTGPVRRLDAPFVHFGEVDVHTKVDKINHYSTGLVVDKQRRGQRFTRLRMLLYPPWFFVRGYIFKRQFLNGWAGFISAICGAFYVFLKYAKLFESRQPRDEELK